MNCYLCSNDSFTVINNRVRDREDIKVLKCNKCSLVFLDKTDHISESFYQNGEMEKTLCAINIIENPNIYNTTDSIDTEKRFKLHNNLMKDKRILDFGCGAGSFLRKLKEEKISAKLYALEPNTELHDMLKKDFTVYSSIDELPDNSFDVISLFHVVEHIPDPLKTLNQLYNKLVDGGKIIIEIPNAQDALLKLYECEAFSNFTYWSCHLYLFSPSTIERLIKKTKYKLNEIKQYQRYSLANHLHWLAKNKPGGHVIWDFLDGEALQLEYEKKLAELGQCDSLITLIEK